MPIARIGSDLVYYAHVPKCAGSSVEDYMRDRFGPLAFLDRAYLSLAERERWSKSSPQHIDWGAATRLFPDGFFTASFAVVRHPVSRAVSAYQFQQSEGTVPAGQGLSAWLTAALAAEAPNPYFADGHVRPQVDFLPPDAHIFHLEHGLDALIPYFDALAGDRAGPRLMGHTNSHTSARPKIVPTPEDIEVIAKHYAADFERLGYRVDIPDPLTPAPVLDADLKAEIAKARAAGPVVRMGRKLRRKLRERML